MAKSNRNVGKSIPAKEKMTPKRASVIQSRAAITEGVVTKKSFTSRATSAAAKNTVNGVLPGVSIK